MQHDETNGNRSTPTVDAGDAAEVEKLMAEHEGSDYVEAVVELAEQSERNYRAAVNAGYVVNGFTDSTNY